MPNFCRILDYFSKWNSPQALLNFEKSSNMPKIRQRNEEKPCSTGLKPIFRFIPDVLDPSLCWTVNTITYLYTTHNETLELKKYVKITSFINVETQKIHSLQKCGLRARTHTWWTIAYLHPKMMWSLQRPKRNLTFKGVKNVYGMINQDHFFKKQNMK